MEEEGGGGGIIEEIVAAITSILAPSVYFAISTCLEIQIEVPAVSTCFLICGSSHFGAETRERVPIQTVPVKLRPLCQSTWTWCKVSLEIRNYYPM